MLTNVDPEILLAETGNVASNIGATAGEVTGAAGSIVGMPPAGTDEASALGTLGISEHSLEFLAVSLKQFFDEAQYAAGLGTVAVNYETTDTANATMFA
ncbi:PE family [Mycobacteroides abscessus subsp. abscessus]|uniref:PE family protein n=1 Tax=Mycobacteroides abscessus TaxID=36809 RepID=UPI000928D4CE|nr:PE family protein [Mycobacteroides abscessus]SHU64898.1 PE family [Mycobacteroides abscessus subsp. abscessus]